MIQRLFNVDMQLNIEKRGYFPKGGGIVTMKTTPVQSIPAFTLTEFGNITRVLIRCNIAKIPVKVADRAIEACSNLLRNHIPDGVEIETEIDKTLNSLSPGTGIIVIAETDTGAILGGSSLGAKKKRAEVMGKEAARELLKSIKAQVCADEYLTDQLIQFMALAHGESKLLCGPLSLHTRTAIHFSELMTGGDAKFDVEEISDKQFIISCSGCGYEAL